MLFPTRWRGHRRDRAIRELLLHTVIQATNEPDNYDIWVKRFASLNALALSGGIHTTQVNEVKKILRS